MKTSFINIKATDGILLHGLLFQSDDTHNKIIIHIHGLAGNFYENSFIAQMAEYYTSKGFSFLSFNNRGHDYISDLVNMNTGESSLGGAAYETFEECSYDIEGAIEYVRTLGYKDIILQGHSSGANKLVYYLSRKPEKVNGLVLISPCDDVGLHLDAVGRDKMEELLKLANDKISSGLQYDLMPPNTFFDTLLSAKTYAECFYSGSSMDTFPYRDPDNTFEFLRSIQLPIFVSFGTKGDLLLQPIEFVEKVLRQKISDKAKLTFTVISGASHSYTGKEIELSSEIIKWIENIGDIHQDVK